MVLESAGLLNSFPQAASPEQLPSVEELLQQGGLLPGARQVTAAIQRKERNSQRLMDRMDADEDRYNLKPFVPDEYESIAPEDAYTTNAPRVLAEKIVSFIAATETIIRTLSDNAQEQQEEANDAVEQLAIGMVNNANRRLRRKGLASVEESIAWYSVVRGRYAAARAVLRKRENGETYDDILPLDPRHLHVELGDEEPIWASYRMRRNLQAIRDEYPNYKFSDTSNVNSMEEEDTLNVYEYYCRKPNPMHDPFSDDPFTRHPWVYLAGTVIDDEWARPLHNLWMLTFPVVLAPVTSQPLLAPSDTDDEQETAEHFGESVFAENRDVWDRINRNSSYLQDIVSKASDPPIDVTSTDGTKVLDDGANDKGAQRSLSTANQESIGIGQTADINRAALFLTQQLSQDAVSGGLPPQAFGLLDKPLSSVALRQLGNNLEHRILPRLRAVAACLEGCIENLVAQYETGAFQPITVSGRRFDNHIFANRVIKPEDIQGHDPIVVKMDLALPEDESSRWSVAQMAMTPTATGEPLASMEWVRERILKMESSKLISSQNLEVSGKLSDPLSNAMEHFHSFMRDGDMPNASIWYDKLTALSIQRQVEIQMSLMQLYQLAQQAGLPLNQQPPMNPAVLGTQNGQSQQRQGGALTNGAASRQAYNPANGATPAVEFTGIGNQPSEDAGYNTTADRQRLDTGLLGPDGQPISG